MGTLCPAGGAIHAACPRARLAALVPAASGAIYLHVSSSRLSLRSKMATLIPGTGTYLGNVG